MALSSTDTERRTPEGHRCVALLDVDHTLLFGTCGFDDAALQLNDAMLDALVSHGVRDVFLFTDMTLSTASVQERLSLVEILRERYEFEVHGALTPCDLTWEAIDEAEAMRLHELCFGPESVYDGVLYGESFAEFLRSNRDELPRIAEVHDTRTRGLTRTHALTHTRTRTHTHSRTHSGRGGLRPVT
jgi:hypothetical protein